MRERAEREKELPRLSYRDSVTETAIKVQNALQLFWMINYFSFTFFFSDPEITRQRGFMCKYAPRKAYVYNLCFYIVYMSQVILKTKKEKSKLQICEICSHEDKRALQNRLPLFIYYKCLIKNIRGTVNRG